MVPNGRFDDVDGVDDVRDVAEGGHVADRADAAVDDPDAPWRPAPDRGPAAAPNGDGPPTVARSDDPGRIVLSHDPAASAWARPGSPGRVPETPVMPSSSDRVEWSAPAHDARQRSDGVSTDDPQSGPSSGATSQDGSVPVDDPEATPAGDVDAASPRRARSRGPLVVVGLSVVVALVGAAVLFTVPGSDRSTPVVPGGPRLPDGAETAWTTRIDGAVETAAAGDGLVAVVLSDGLTVLDGEDGEVLWRRVNAADAGEIERVAVIDGRVVVTQQSTVGTTEVRSFDPDTGTELWRTRGREGTHSVTGPAHAPIIVGRSRVDQATVMTVLDPVDGSALAGPLRMSGVEAVGGDLAVAPTDRQVALWSADELDVVAGPVDEFNLRTVAELDGSVVALDLEGRIVAFDADGRRSDELLLVATDGSVDGGEAIASVDLVGVTSTGVGVVSGESSLGFTVVDGRIETAWERPGFVSEPVDTSMGALNVVVTTDESGEIAESILDSVTGTVVRPIVAPGPRERLSALAWNGYVIAPAVGASERVVAAVDHDGEPLWSLSLSPQADYELTSEGIVVIDPTPGGAEVTLAR